METEDSVKRFLTKRNLIIAVVLLLLLAAIPFALKLVQTQTFFKPKATTEPITVTGPGVSGNSQSGYTVQSPNIQLELRSPLAPPPPSNPSGGR